MFHRKRRRDNCSRKEEFLALPTIFYTSQIIITEGGGSGGMKAVTDKEIDHEAVVTTAHKQKCHVFTDHMVLQRIDSIL